METAKISQLFRKQISPGQHDCSERDMTRNEKLLSLVLSLILMSSEDQCMSLPGWCSHYWNCAESTSPYSWSHKTVLKVNNTIAANSFIHQNSHTNVSYLLVTGTPLLKGGYLICSGCLHCSITSLIDFIIFLQRYRLQVVCWVERTAASTPTATWNLCQYFSVCVPKR